MGTRGRFLVGVWGYWSFGIGLFNVWVNGLSGRIFCNRDCSFGRPMGWIGEGVGTPPPQWYVEKLMAFRIDGGIGLYLEATDTICWYITHALVIGLGARGVYCLCGRYFKCAESGLKGAWFDDVGGLCSCGAMGSRSTQLKAFLDVASLLAIASSLPMGSSSFPASSCSSAASSVRNVTKPPSRFSVSASSRRGISSSGPGSWIFVGVSLGC